ncbi:MAG: hotdog fold domain-containing protein [Elusimicrobiota bacterium]
MSSVKAPEIIPNESWEPVDPFPESWKSGNFIPHGDTDGRLSLRYFRDRSDASLKAWAWFGPGAEGAPGRIHGGGVSAILDEVLGAAAWIVGLPVVTGLLTVKYRRPLNVGAVCEIETFITKKGAKRVHVRGTLSARGGGLSAEAEGMYFRLPDSELPDMVAQIMSERRTAQPAPSE